MDKAALSAVAEVIRDLRDETEASIEDLASRTDQSNASFVKANALNDAIKVYAQDLIRQRSEVVSQTNGIIPKYFGEL
jgi:hypothetical protein